MKRKRILTNREVNELMLTCEKCHHSFIFTTVIMMIDSITDDTVIKLMPQEDVYFCPYCGNKKIT